MKTSIRKPVFTMLFAAGWIGTALFVHRAARLTGRIDALAKEDARSRAEERELKRQIASTDSERAGLGPIIRELQSEILRGREFSSSGETQEPGPGRAPPPTETGPVRSPGNPAVRKSRAIAESAFYKKVLAQNVAHEYSEILAQLGLDESTRKAVEELLGDRELFQNRLGELFLDESLPVEEILTQRDRKKFQVDAALSRLMTPDQMERWRAFETNRRAEGRTESAPPSVTALNLRPEQQMARLVLSEERNVLRSELGLLTRFGHTSLLEVAVEEVRRFRFHLRKPGDALDRMSSRHLESREKLRLLLTEEQYRILLQEQERERDSLELLLRDLGARFQDEE